jgi:hypothetical protein
MILYRARQAACPVNICPDLTYAGQAEWEVPDMRSSSVSLGEKMVTARRRAGSTVSRAPPASSMTGTPARRPISATSMLTRSGISRCSRIPPAVCNTCTARQPQCCPAPEFLATAGSPRPPAVPVQPCNPCACPMQSMGLSLTLHCVCSLCRPYVVMNDG